MNDFFRSLLLNGNNSAKKATQFKQSEICPSKVIFFSWKKIQKLFCSAYFNPKFVVKY